VLSFTRSSPPPIRSDRVALAPRSSTSRIHRLAILNSHPIQYFAPLYRRSARESEIDLTIYYCSRQGLAEHVDPDFGVSVQWDVPLLEGYESRFLPNPRRRDRVGGLFSLINPSIVREVHPWSFWRPTRRWTTSRRRG
jgi:hypothetical protein